MSYKVITKALSKMWASEAEQLDLSSPYDNSTEDDYEYIVGLCIRSGKDALSPDEIATLILDGPRHFRPAKPRADQETGEHS